MGAQRDAHLFGSHPKRILSLDGGGVRGLITLGMLKRVEQLLRARSPNPATFRLSDYFDLIGGTSTGALIGAMLAMGISVDRIVQIYFDMIPQIFINPRPTAGFRTKFDPDVFNNNLNQTFDELLAKDLDRADLLEGEIPHREPRLCSDVLKTGLAVVTKRIDTNSVWIITNNPKSKYWTPNNAFWLQKPVGERERFNPNKDYSLRDVVRASASAPYYLDAVELQIDEKTTGLFLDGGATPHNNPAAELFFLATLRGHEEDIASPTGFGWNTGADRLLLLSLGTGKWPERINSNEYRGALAYEQAMTALRGMISDGQQTSLTWMQALSEPAVPAYIDGNLDSLAGLRIVKEPLLTFQHVNPVLETGWLQENLGVHYDVDPEAIATMREFDVPSLSNLNRLYEVGLETGRRMIKSEFFSTQFDAHLETID